MTVTPGAPTLGGQPSDLFVSDDAPDTVSPVESAPPVESTAVAIPAPSPAGAVAPPPPTSWSAPSGTSPAPAAWPPQARHLAGPDYVQVEDLPTSPPPVPESQTKDPEGDGVNAPEFTEEAREVPKHGILEPYFDAQGCRHVFKKSQRAMLAEIQQLATAIRDIDVDDVFAITVLSTIGGVGKTYLTAHLLRILAILRRRAQMMGIDINPDRGFLEKRLGISGSSSLEQIHGELGQLDSLTKVHKRVMGDSEGVSVIAAEWDATSNTDFAEKQFDDVFDHFKQLTHGFACDGGTGVLKMTVNLAALRRSNQLIYLTRLGEEGFTGTEADFNQFEQRGFKEHLKRAILVVSMITPEQLSSGSNAKYSYNHFKHVFGERVAHVMPVMIDPYLATRQPVDLEQLSTAVLLQYFRIVYLALLGCSKFVPELRKTPPAPAARTNASEGK